MKEDEKSQTLGVIVGHRDIFPNRLAEVGGRRVVKNLEDFCFNVVTTFSKESGEGAVQERDDSRECAEPFRERAEDINGVLITLPNFGDEKNMAESLRVIMSLYLIQHNEEKKFVTAEPLGPGGDPYPAMHAQHDSEELTRMVNETIHYFRSRENIVKKSCGKGGAAEE